MFYFRLLISNTYIDMSRAYKVLLFWKALYNEIVASF